MLSHCPTGEQFHGLFVVGPQASAGGFDAATLYACTLFQPNMAARVRTVFPVQGSPAGLAGEATVCAQMLQTVSRGDNLTAEGPLRD